MGRRRARFGGSGLRATMGLVGAIALLSAGGNASAADPDRTIEGPPSLHDGEIVVLLHGLGRSSFSMRSLASTLEEAGFETINVDYPSTDLEADGLGGVLADRIAECCADAERLHFVTHSLGGIVVRAYLAAQRPDNLGRVVMLAPPNHGSEWVDALREVAVFEWIMGPVALELGTDPESLPNRLPPADYPVGIIAGNRVVNPVGAKLIPGDDDGTVAVSSTRLDGMTDFIELPESHTFIMDSDEVGRQVVGFLETGHFDHDHREAVGPRPEASRTRAED